MQLRGGQILVFFAKIGPPWGTDFGKRGPFLAAKIGPAGPNLAAKVVRGDQFWQLFCQNQSSRTSFRGDRFWRDRPSGFEKTWLLCTLLYAHCKLATLLIFNQSFGIVSLGPRVPSQNATACKIPNL